MKKQLHNICALLGILIISPLFSQNLNGNWTLKGPIAFPTNISGQINGIGRVSQIKFHPSNSQKIYAVSASGGLWISNDAGENWNPTATDTEIPFGKCSSVCIDPTNDNIIYLSTGDANWDNNGMGIYKSTNGGVTWFASNTNIGNLMATEILISPNDHNIVIAATRNGIWRSTNGGANWTQTRVGGKFKDMEYKPGSTSIIYAVNEGQFFKSTNDGVTWTQIADVNPSSGNGGRISTTPADPDVVYVGFVGSSSNGVPYGGYIFKSTDSGDHFVRNKGNDQPNLNGYSDREGGQGDYNWDIYADRVDANTLYAAGHIIWKSTDSGVTWQSLTNWRFKCHTDMHQLVTSPYDNSKFYNANDGGIFVSTDGCVNWTQKSNGLSATEVFHMGQSKLSRDIVCLGTQDNGEIYLNNNEWICNRGGDWYSKSSFDYANPNTAYYHSPAKRRDLVLNNSETSFGVSSPNSSNCYVFSDQNTSFGLVSQYTELKKTTNLLAASPVWNTIRTFTANIKNIAVSPNDNNETYVVLEDDRVYYSADGVTFNFTSYTPTTTLDYSNIVVNKNDTSIVYLTCGSKIYRSADKAVTWTDITGTLETNLNPTLNPTPDLNILSLVHDPYSTDESFYLATAAGIYYRNNTMTNWRPFSSGLPLIANITDLFGYFDGTNNSRLRVSFYGRGVWESNLYSTTLATNQHTYNAETIRTYPNPATDIITLNVTNPSLMNTKAILVDVTGKQIKEIEIKQPVTLLDFAGYAKGIYILKFSNNITQKIVIE